MTILLYGCTTWMLTKRMEKKLDGNYTRILRVIFNKSRRQNPTKQQLYGHLPFITKTIQVRRTRHSGHCWRCKDKPRRGILMWTPSHGRPVEPIYNSSVPIKDLVWMTSLGRWTIETGGEKESDMCWQRDMMIMMVKYCKLLKRLIRKFKKKNK